jgi:hypothetical protein
MTDEQISGKFIVFGIFSKEYLTSTAITAVLVLSSLSMTEKTGCLSPDVLPHAVGLFIL